MPAKKKEVGKKKKIVTKKGKDKIEVKKGPSIDFSGVKKQDVYMKDPFKPELYPRVQGHESLLKAAYGQLGGRVLQGGGAIVGAPGRMLTQQPPPPFVPPAFQGQGPSQNQSSMFTELLASQKRDIERLEKELERKISTKKGLTEDEENIMSMMKNSFSKVKEDYEKMSLDQFSAIHPAAYIFEFRNSMIKNKMNQTEEGKQMIKYLYNIFKAMTSTEKLYKSKGGDKEMEKEGPGSKFVIPEKKPDQEELQPEPTTSLPKAPFFTTPVMGLTDKELQKIFVYSKSKPASELTVAERNLVALARREDARRKEKPKPPEETGKISTQTGTLLDVIRAQEKGQDNVVRAHSGAFTSPPSMSIDEFLEKGPPPRGGGGGGRSKEEELAMSKLPPAMKDTVVRSYPGTIASASGAQERSVATKSPQQQMPDNVVLAHSGAFTSPLGESMYRDELVTVPSPRPLDYYASGVEAELEPGLKNIVSERRLAKLQDWADDRARYLEYKRLEKEYENSLIPFEDIRAGLVRKEMGRVYKFPWDVVQPRQFQRINPEGEEIFYTEEPAEFSQIID